MKKWLMVLSLILALTLSSCIPGTEDLELDATITVNGVTLTLGGDAIACLEGNTVNACLKERQPDIEAARSFVPSERISYEQEAEDLLQQLAKQDSDVARTLIQMLRTEPAETVRKLRVMAILEVYRD